MNVQTILVEWLKEHGYDGLYSDGDCCCGVDDLVPCGENPSSCEPGYKVPCPGPAMCWWGGCEFHIAAEKPDGKET